jgi:hypothetical protein
VLAVWVPLVVLTASIASYASHVALLKDYRVFTRAFVAIPFLIAGRTLTEERFSLIVSHFSDAGLSASRTM